MTLITTARLRNVSLPQASFAPSLACLSRGQVANRSAARTLLQSQNLLHFLHALLRCYIFGNFYVSLDSTAVLPPFRGAAHAHCVLADVGRSAAVQGIIRSDSTAALANATLPVGWLNDKLKHIQNAFFFCRQYYRVDGWISTTSQGLTIPLMA